MSLASLAGANVLAAQDGPPETAPLAFPGDEQLNDPTIPPLVGGIPATPKTPADAPRGGVTPGTWFQSAADAPAINVWYGTNQTFGPNGDPQKWVNIMGNVTSAAPLTSLTYSLNGGSNKQLSIGPNSSRLVRTGDFNIELDYTDLLAGNNTVTIVATDNAGGVTPANVIVNYQARAAGWPTPQTITIDWSTATKVNDVAQVVDGNWMISGGKARPTSLADTGFDRLIAIGDISWRNYTVTVPVTIHSLHLNKSPGVGLIVRWQGHFDAGNSFQPVVGWRRLGAMAWYRYEKATATEGLQLLGNGGNQIGVKGFSPVLNTTYLYKVGISPNADPTKPATYRFKVWPQGQAEPAAWDIEAAGLAGEPRNGSIVLVAHNADVSFGNVTVDLTATEPKPELTINKVGTGSGVVNPVPQKAAYRFGEDVSLTAVPDSGSTFAGWQGDAQGSANPTTVEMFADRTVVAQFSNPSVATPISDDFNSCDLNPQLWSFVNPLGDASVAMTGGHAEISVPAGSAHDLWTSGRNAPRIMQFAENKNFEFVVKFDSAMSTKNQAQGIVIEGDAQNYLRFNFLHDGSSYKAQAFYFTGGTPTEKLNSSITITPPMYLRVKRLGDVWNLHYSGDGTTWSFGAGFSYPLTVSSYGVYAGNSNQNPAHTAKIDYFFNAASPITPEDNDRKLNITTTGSGSVTRSLVKDNYACGEVVSLTPVPAAGFKFDSWGGDLTGAAVPGQLTMNATKNVTANFVPSVQYTVSVSASGAGTVTKSPDVPFYSAGEMVTLTATPSLGNVFVNWSGGVTGSVNPYTVPVNSNLSVVGNFAAAPNRTLTLTPIGNGTINADPAGPSYLHGQKVTLTAVAGPDASFASWGGAASGMSNTVEVVMDADKSVSASFKDNIYTLTLNADPADKGSVTPSPQKAKYYQDEVVQLTPNPAPGYKFAGWSGDLTGDDVPGELVMTKDTTVTATFIPGETYTLTINTAGGDGSVIPTPLKTEYGYNEIVTLDAQAGPGFEFVSWSGDYVGTDDPATVTITKDMVITAHFAGEGIYSLNIVPPTNGTITVSPVRDLYAQNEQVTLTPVPALGYVFSGWGGDASGTDDPLVLTMTGDKTVSATFTIAPNYTLAVTTNGPGTFTVDPPETNFIAGTTVTLTATATPGYVFTGWSGDVISNNNPYQLLMDGNKNIVANFGEAGDVVSDDFSGCSVINPLWTWVDPLGQANYEMTGSQAKIIVPASVDYEIWKNGNDSARLVQEVANTDFEIFVKLESPVTKAFQTQGVLIETDNDTFVRADINHDGTGVRFFAGAVDNGTSRKGFNISLTPPASSPIYLRILRNGDTFRMFYRYDENEQWVNFKGNSFKFSMDVQRVGMFAATQPNGAQPAPAHTALFDYFFNAAQPITPEDADAPSLVVTPVGQGSVALTPITTSYTCGQQVQLKATADAGWRFQNWSGSLNGSSPTQLLTITGRHEVTATFVRLEEIKLFLPLTIR
ncbi:MAG: InlB B-repeat-containing protein [Candidatus Promineofilum sp.]|nr:InlB B-repeat-containing protein [Promineifilum sp.]